MESTIYVQPEVHARGVGSALLASLIDHARADRRAHTLLAVIVSGNVASQALHRKMGFMHVGTLREVSRKGGEWLGVDYYQLFTEPQC